MRKDWLAVAGTGLAVAAGILIRAGQNDAPAAERETAKIRALETERDRLAAELADARAQLADVADLRRRIDELADELMQRGDPPSA